MFVTCAVPAAAGPSTAGALQLLLPGPDLLLAQPCPLHVLLHEGTLGLGVRHSAVGARQCPPHAGLYSSTVGGVSRALLSAPGEPGLWLAVCQDSLEALGSVLVLKRQRGPSLRFCVLWSSLNPCEELFIR